MKRRRCHIHPYFSRFLPSVSILLPLSTEIQCCPCTCSDGPVHSCIDNKFDNCEYPECDQPTDSDEAACIESYHGDGYCDEVENNLSCGFDGGDVSILYLRCSDCRSVHAVCVPVCTQHDSIWASGISLLAPRQQLAGHELNTRPCVTLTHA